MRSGDYDLLVFDELVLRLEFGMLPTAEVLQEGFDGCAPRSPAAHRRHRRDAPEVLIEAADLSQRCARSSIHSTEKRTAFSRKRG